MKPPYKPLPRREPYGLDGRRSPDRARPTLALSGGIGAVLAACGARPQPATPPPTDTPPPQAAAPTDTPRPTNTPQPTPAVSAEPTKQTRKILRSENRPDFDVRYVERPEPMPPLTIRPPLRVLVMAANPMDRDELDVARERDNLEQALRPLIERGAVTVDRLDWHNQHRHLRPGHRRILHAGIGASGR